MSVTELGMSMLFKPVYENAPSLMVFTFSEILAVDRLEHLEKALMPMLVTELGMVTLFKPEDINAPLSLIHIS